MESIYEVFTDKYNNDYIKIMGGKHRLVKTLKKWYGNIVKEFKIENQKYIKISADDFMQFI